MSVFKVRLQYNPQQGYLDLNPSTASANFLGTPFVTSIQRTMFCAGPNRIYRELSDGQTFTDCNYWKRFAVPQVSADVAFIEVVSDDGSVYSDVASENNFPYIYSPYTVLNTATFTNNSIDILGTLGGPAQFVQITNNGTIANQDITIKLNGSATAIMTLVHGATQIFNSGDLQITSLAFQGGVATTTLQIILSVHIACNT